MMTPPAPATCPKCHAVLPPGAPHGLCPACLMEAAGTESEPGISSDPFAAPLDLETLRLAFPQLEILAPLGAGGMGRVYKARQPNLDRIVALKVLPPEFARDPAWIERFTREARALARLNHPHIVQVYDVGQTTPAPGVPALCWLIMEYVDGVTLRQVQRTGGISAREALALIPKLCDALQYAHEKGVLHRDIKPENILLDASGHVKIADFGLAKLGGANPSPALTMAGARLGTAAYMAPEQIESPRDVDHRADIYSLGVVFYELLTGGLPLGRFPAPSEKSGTDPRLDKIVFRTLEKERTRRYQAAGDVRTALENVAAAPAPAAPLPHAERQAPPANPTDPTVLLSPAGSPPPAVQRVPLAEILKPMRDKIAPVASSVAEYAGRGCGHLLISLFVLPVAILPVFFVFWWFEIINDVYDGRPPDWTGKGAIAVAALAGITAWLGARPVWIRLRCPRAQPIVKIAPLLLLAAFLIWGVTLLLIARTQRTWPTSGSARTMIVDCEQPPVSVEMTAGRSGYLRSLLEREVYLVFSKLPVIAITDITGIDYDHHYTNHSFRTLGHRDPLRKRLRVSVAGQSSDEVDAGLREVAKGLARALPADVSNSMKITLLEGSAYGDRPALHLGDDEPQILAGLFMALGGWLAALGIGRPRLSAAAPFACLFLAGGAWLLPPGSILPGKEIIPLPEHSGISAMSRSDVRTMGAAEENNADKSPEATFYLWANACMRLDRTLAASLMTHNGASLTDEEWKRIAAFWTSRTLIHASVATAETPDKATASIVAIPWEARRPSPSPNSRWNYNSEGTTSKSFVLPMIRGTSGWQIGDTSSLVP